MTLAPETPVAADDGAAAPTFESLDPGRGTVLASYPVASDEDVAAAVARAKDAAAWWRAQGFHGRRRVLRAFKGVLARELEDLAEVVHLENGKPRSDAILEVALAIDHLEWAAKHAPSVLGPRRVPSGLMASNQAATLEYQPLGVVGVIGPWNYPVFTPMGSIAYALAAGNAVVFKPSEFTPGVGVWLGDAWRRAVPERPDVLQVVTGLGATGAALCRSGVDKVAFTGSAPTGRKVMAACAEGLVPVLMECGGKDAMIVDDDADVSAAVDAALWGGMSNAGQTCVGIERVYATDKVYDRFVAELAERAAEVRAGSGDDAHYGPITMPSQVGIIERHIADAVADGGRILTGGTVTDGVVAPTVIVDVPEHSSAVREETFGPTLTVTKVRTAEEAIERTNATAYGLAGSIFTAKAKRGMALARQMRSGMASINAVNAFSTIPGLPFGGVGESGFGRIHGADGLREFSRSKAITRQRFALPIPTTSFRRPPEVTDRLVKVIRFVHGRK